MKIILNNGKEIEVECSECEEESRYDEQGNLIWHKYRDGTIEEWKYDKDGEEIWFKDTDGIYWIDGKPYREVKQ